MAHDELIHEFNGLLDDYAKHREYIAKAKAQAAKFSPAVIEKVILDHEIKSSDTAERVLPHVPSLLAGIVEIDSEKARIDRDKSGSVEKMEELELRAAIGEITSEEFDELSSEFRATLDGAAGRVNELDHDRAILQSALDRWVELATSAGQATGVTQAPSTAEDNTLLGDEMDEAPAEPDLMAVDDQPVVDDGRGQHLTVGHTREDVSAVFSDSPAVQADQALAEDDALIEVAEAIEGTGDEASSDVDFGFDDGDDFLAEADGAEVQLDLVEENADADEDIAVVLGTANNSAQASPSADEGDQGRRALLLYQEGTAEEQIYPFTGDVLTVGRGRDNDIQIKNDSKVSRFHCRMFRKGGQFYIEDNKSSNGTLVNGELITERRLFGGEEVIIGETFFRFRIM